MCELVEIETMVEMSILKKVLGPIWWNQTFGMKFDTTRSIQE